MESKKQRVISKGTGETVAYFTVVDFDKFRLYDADMEDVELGLLDGIGLYRLLDGICPDWQIVELDFFDDDDLDDCDRGNYLSHYRAECDMTQRELAEKVGCRRETVAKIEKGRYNPSLALADKFAAVLDVPLYDLFDLRSKHAYRRELEDREEAAFERGLCIRCREF